LHPVIEIGAADHTAGQLHVVLIVRVVDVGDADLVGCHGEDVVAMAGAVHPGLKDGSGIRMACGDVLARPYPIDITCRQDAVAQAVAVGTDVAEEVVIRHVKPVALGGEIEVSVADEGRQAIRSARLIDQLKDLLLEGCPVGGSGGYHGARAVRGAGNRPFRWQAVLCGQGICGRGRAAECNEEADDCDNVSPTVM
jgi:hypothetical protein